MTSWISPTSPTDVSLACNGRLLLWRRRRLRRDWLLRRGLGLGRWWWRLRRFLLGGCEVEGRTSIRPSTTSPLSFVGRVARIHRVGDGPGVARFTFTTADVSHCWIISAFGLRARRYAGLEAWYQSLTEEGTEKKEGALASGDRTGQLQVWLVHAHLQFHVGAQRGRNQEQKQSAKQEMFCRDKNKSSSSLKA